MIILMMVLGFVSLLLQIIFSFNLKGWKNDLLYQVTSVTSAVGLSKKKKNFIS